MAYPATASKRREHAEVLRNTLHAGIERSGKGPKAKVIITMTEGDFALLDTILTDIENPSEWTYQAMRDALDLSERVRAMFAMASA
jgi:hypothetical protein